MTILKGKNKELQKEVRQLKNTIKQLENELKDKPKKVAKKQTDDKAEARTRMKEWREKLK